MKGYPKDFQIGIVLPKTHGPLDISAAFSYLIRWKYKYLNTVYNPRDCYSANILADLILSEAFSVEGLLDYSAMN